MRIVTAAAILVTLSACSLGQRTALTIEDDCGFADHVVVRSPSTTVQGSSYGYFRSYVTCSTGEPRHQVYSRTAYMGDWRFYRSARLEGAQPLEFSRVDSDVNCGGGSCTLSEHMIAYIPDSTLRATPPDTLRLRFYARSGHEMNVLMAPETIGQQLAAVDSVATAVTSQ